MNGYLNRGNPEIVGSVYCDGISNFSLVVAYINCFDAWGVKKVGNGNLMGRCAACANSCCVELL